MYITLGFPGGTSGKEPTCQYRRHKRCRFHPWARKIPWRRAWQPTPVFLPGESHGQRSLVGYSLWVEKSRTQLKRQCAHAHAHTHTHTQLYGFSHFLTHPSLELSSLKVHLKCSLCSLKVHWIPTMSYVVYSFQHQEPQTPWCPLPWGKHSIKFCDNHFLDFLEFYNPYVYVCVSHSVVFHSLQPHGL